MPPEPITVTLSRIFIHHEVSRGEVLIALNQKLDLISNGNLVACGTALPEKINETMNIPLVCMTAYQRILANLDNIFWDYGVPLLCIGALGVGILFFKKAMDYVDDTGTLTVEPESWKRAQARVNVEKAVKEEKFRRGQQGRDIYIGLGDSYIDANPRTYTAEDRAAHRAAFTRAQNELEKADRREAEERFGIPNDTNFVVQTSQPVSHQEVVSSLSHSQRRDARWRADKVEAELAAHKLANLRITGAEVNSEEVTFTGEIGASANGSVTEDDILEHTEHLEMTQGTSGGIWVKIVGKMFRIIFRR